MISEKEILIKAALAAVREIDMIAEAKAFTYGSALNLIFNAILKSGTVEITGKDIDEIKQRGEK